jgi:hypothetical protein
MDYVNLQPPGMSHQVRSIYYICFFLTSRKHEKQKKGMRFNSVFVNQKKQKMNFFSIIPFKLACKYALLVEKEEEKEERRRK